MSKFLASRSSCKKNLRIAEHQFRCVVKNSAETGRGMARLFNPWVVLIELRGKEFNRRINSFRGLGKFNDFNRGIAIIGFRTTGALQCINNAWDSPGMD